MSRNDTTFAEQLLAELRAWEPSGEAIASTHTLPPQHAVVARLPLEAQDLLPPGIEYLILLRQRWKR
jgi:hypothetical protein